MQATRVPEHTNSRASMAGEQKAAQLRIKEPTDTPPRPVLRTVGAVTESDAHVMEILADGRCRLDSGLLAERAYSCLLEPAAGDRVLCYQGSAKVDSKAGMQDDSNGDLFILAILSRAQQECASLKVPGCRELAIRQPKLGLQATEEISLTSMRDINLTAVSGTIQNRAKQLVQSALGAIVETARERISSADFTQFKSRYLTRIHGQQTMLTADSDIKIDAERVNLG